MSPDTDKKATGSLMARLVSQRRPLWLTVAISLLLILMPFGAAYLDGVLEDYVSQGAWRVLLLPSVVIIYILVVTPIMTQKEAEVVEAFRPLLLIDDDDLDRLVDEASRLNPIGEVAALGLGGALGLWVSQSWVYGTDAFWLKLCLSLWGTFMFGLLGWVIYAAVSGTRLTAELHRQPLRFDIFDTKPFEPIGRQSLTIALVFVGGIVLSMLFLLGQGSFDWQNLLFAGILLLVPVLVFFLNMRDTHRVLAAEKERELEAVQQRILQACRTLMERMGADESSGTLAAEINALVAYEARLLEARTWPYNTAMLRTLFFSAVIPGGAALARVASEVLFK